MSCTDLFSYENMSERSRERYDMARSSNLSLADAKKELIENACERSVKEILVKALENKEANDEELKEILAKALVTDEADEKLYDIIYNKIIATEPAVNRDSIRHDVNNWVKCKVNSATKDNGFLLSFAFGLDLENADLMIMRLCGERIYWRNPKELVYGFALNTGRTFEEAEKLYSDLNEKKLFDYENAVPDVYTSELEYDLRNIETREDLEICLDENRGKLRTLHYTATKTLQEFMDYLKKPASADFIKVEEKDEEKPEEKAEGNAKKRKKANDKLTLEEIVCENLYGGVVPNIRTVLQRRNDNLLEFALRRCIATVWPRETTLSSMYSSSKEPSRKALILLFLATDGASSMYANHSEREMSQEDIYEDRSSRLRNMLIDCGYAPLDPRAPFDWLVLYCLCDDEGFVDDEKMQNFLSTIFTDETEME